MLLSKLLLLLITISIGLIVFNFIYFLFKYRIRTGKIMFSVVEIWTVIIGPLIFLDISDFGLENDCCGISALFSPHNKLGVYFLMIASVVCYFGSSFRSKIFPPIPEVILNVFLLLGLLLNVLISIQIAGEEWGFILVIIGNIPIMLLFMIQIWKNHLLLKSHIETNNFVNDNRLCKISLSVLQLKPFYKFSILTLLALPFLVILSLLLILFGQKPDSLIRAFTDTYRQGFSELSYMCDNVNCGGHYLCSVAAKGHQRVVKPIRLGIRKGKPILCNRQLLISNAFEELLQNGCPLLHRWIRRRYDKVGTCIHKYYFLFNNRVGCDLIYILMKPAEWFFLIVLYTFRLRPESHIEKQYTK